MRRAYGTPRCWSWPPANGVVTQYSSRPLWGSARPVSFFFLNIPPTPEISPFPLPAPLPIYRRADSPLTADAQAGDRAEDNELPDARGRGAQRGARRINRDRHEQRALAPDAIGYPPEQQDRKSTRLNSSHDQISYAVFCLKKK